LAQAVAETFSFCSPKTSSAITPSFPRHTKQYRNLFQMEQTLQTERVEGFKDFIKDVRSGGFPGPEHTVKAPEGLIAQFLEAIE
jgi:3-methyl-2-oxobutanoate hydroxymethyltransferase